MYQLQSSIITPSSGAKNSLGRPIDLEECKELIKKTLEHLFNRRNDFKFSELNWEALWDMIKDPLKPMGLAAVDDMKNGVYSGLMFNLGIPKLRSRRIHYMPRIYMYISRDYDNFCTFYNSSYDVAKDDVKMILRTKQYAYHPHISEGKPCLGNFLTNLVTAQHNNNAMMYLIIAHKFVNTWNARSPFFSIYHQKQDFVIGDKSFTEGQMVVAYGCKTDGFADYRNFVIKNINKINSGNIMSDLKYLKDIFYFTQDNSSNIGALIKSMIDPELRIYLSGHDYEIIERNEDHPRTFVGQHSVIPRSNIFIIPVLHDSKTIMKKKYTFTRFKTRTIENSNFHHNAMVPINRIRGGLLNHLSNFLFDFRKHMIKNKKLSESILDDEEYSCLDIYCKYLAPNDGRRVAQLDLMNNVPINEGKGGGLPYLMINSSSLKAADLKRKNYLITDFLNLEDVQYRRYRKVVNFVNLKSENVITPDIVNKYMDNYIDKSFSYKTVEAYNNTIEIDYNESGTFWRRSNYRRFDDTLVQTINEIGEMPKSVFSLIETYERIKRSYIEEDTKQVINSYKKQIGELEKYVGYKTNNTSGDTQQVHLSFESI